jgi:HK97 gp10 family phage protein
MAKLEFKMDAGWERAMHKLGTLYDDTAEDMLRAGTAVLAARLKSAGAVFAKYIKIKKPSKNKYGWFAQIYFSGKTSSGAPAGLAANVYEYGRGGENPQPARPFVRPTIESSEKEVVDAMQTVLEEALKKL